MARTCPPSIGERFGWWTVTGEPVMSSPGHRSVPCHCDCGTERFVLVFALRNGTSSSCGCWKAERARTIVAETRWKDSHGRAADNGDPLYRLWKRINRRCHDPKAHNYRWYGARGISVCDEWRHDAGAFCSYIEQTIGPRPPGKSIDRIDNDGDYRPGNVRWATHAEQMANRRAARL
jgi:hypothetical protein